MQHNNVGLILTNIRFLDDFPKLNDANMVPESGKLTAVTGTITVKL